ncbi:MAG: UbiA family prenyltransferase [Candidatus Diapherotrites archaeon]|nr:UbiA family prenyltransferase [Candidatus Diapherotrites archaeon]
MTKDLLEFIRFKICVFLVFFAGTGFLLFNPLGPKLSFVVLAAFFGTAAAYSYNNTQDVKEDSINRGHINRHCTEGSGKWLPALLFGVGLVPTFFLAFESTIFYILSVLSGVVYSFLKLKKYTTLKNVYSAVGITFIFLMGASGNAFPVQSIQYALLFCGVILIGSIISDLRDVLGDEKAGFNTLPVRCGVEQTKGVIYSLVLLLLVLLFVLHSTVKILYIFLPLSAALVAKERYHKAHTMTGYSFVAIFLIALLGGPV